MAKNKNRDRSQQRPRSSAERSEEQAKSSPMQPQGTPQSPQSPQAPQSPTQVSPRDVARKHQKRFGHN
ncbi:hypothetical protein ABZW18_24425 [Streptomyces sp. NPDC004647]|uniref:hypothetical protein n=1 Tax=Streptomyces sp. NPDC004647 TaxID=3154671 RepID=UPI0033B1485F